MDKLSLWKEKVEVKLRQILAPSEPLLLYEAMSYYPLQGGKRIRPLLLCGVCDALGGNVEDAVVVGCAIELIHNYSLIHDDLPALDNDPQRRGLPSCHVAFGEDIALLAGDALLTLAFQVLSDVSQFNEVEPSDLLLIIHEISRRAGSEGMVGGQVMDIRGIGDRREINLKKTAQLFAACFVSAGIIAKKKSMLKDLEKVGIRTGLLFQMCDDWKDKDGYFNLLGEDLAKVIKEEETELKEELRRLSLLTPPIETLINSFIPTYN